MDVIDNNQQVETNVINIEEARGFLEITAKWGKFLAIVGYIGLVIMFAMAFVMVFGLSRIESIPGGPNQVRWESGIAGIAYIVIAVLYFFPVNYLYRFSSRMKIGLASNNPTFVLSGFENLKSLFKFMGIMMIVMLSIWVLAFIAGGLFAFLSL